MIGLDFSYEIYANNERILRGLWFLDSYDKLQQCRLADGYHRLAGEYCPHLKRQAVRVLDCLTWRYVPESLNIIPYRCEDIKNAEFLNSAATDYLNCWTLKMKTLSPSEVLATN